EARTQAGRHGCKRAARTEADGVAGSVPAGTVGALANLSSGRNARALECHAAAALAGRAALSTMTGVSQYVTSGATPYRSAIIFRQPSEYIRSAASRLSQR